MTREVTGKWLTVRQAANKLGISIGRTRELAGLSTLRSGNTPAGLRIDPQSVEDRILHLRVFGVGTRWSQDQFVSHDNYLLAMLQSIQVWSHIVRYADSALYSAETDCDYEQSSTVLDLADSTLSDLYRRLRLYASEKSL